MSAATPPPSEPHPREPAKERCPLCGGPLGAEQEWCLLCGAAARTRLAATPRWRPPVVALTSVIVLSLGALTAALVSLAGSSGAEDTVAVTRTVTVPAAGATTAPGTATTPGAVTTPGATTTSGAATTPGTATGSVGTTTGVPGASTTGTTAPGAGITGAPGTTVPKTGATATAPAGKTPAG